MPNYIQDCFHKIQNGVLRVVFNTNCFHKKRTMPLLITSNCAAADLNWTFKNLKESHWWPLYKHLFEKRLNLAHIYCSIVSNKGTQLKSVALASILRPYMSMEAHWDFIFIEKNVKSKQFVLNMTDISLPHPRLWKWRTTPSFKGI